MAGAASDIPTLDQTPSSSSSSSSATDNNKLYKGVRKRKWGKWVSEIRLPNSRERIWLGSYDSPEKAARAFDAALYCLRGRHANFNFPDTPFNLEINNVAVANQSLTPQEIQVVAAKFANEVPLPLDYHNQEPSQPQQPQRDGANSFGLLSKSDSIKESTYTTTTTASSSSTTMPMPMYEYDGTVQVDHGDMSKMDWTFLNVLDHGSNEVPVGSASDYGLYSEPDKMHSGELLYSTLPPSSFEDNEDEIEGDDPFSHQSFLWNWNF